MCGLTRSGLVIGPHGAGAARERGSQMTVERVPNPAQQPSGQAALAAASNGCCSSSNHNGRVAELTPGEIREVQEQLAALLPRLQRLMGQGESES